MWCIEDSHHWMMIPHTVYERRRELRVREMRQTAIAWDRKYQDIDTGKYNLDKMQAIECLSWNDVVQPDTDEYYGEYRPRKNNVVSLLPLLPEKFVPPDNDFEEECRRDEERKKDYKERHRKGRETLAAKKLETDFEKIFRLTKQELHRAGWIVPDQEISKFIACNVMANSWRPK